MLLPAPGEGRCCAPKENPGRTSRSSRPRQFMALRRVSSFDPTGKTIRTPGDTMTASPPNRESISSLPVHRKPRRWLRWLLIVTGSLLLFAGGLGWSFRDEWFVWHFRRAVRTGGTPLEAIH